ncbi:hypothetical protein CR513_47256, partial [Mucuna pruriens]
MLSYMVILRRKYIWSNHQYLLLSRVLYHGLAVFALSYYNLEKREREPLWKGSLHGLQRISMVYRGTPLEFGQPQPWNPKHSPFDELTRGTTTAYQNL